MLGNRNSVLGNEQKATFIHTQFAHVYALIFMCTHTHTHIFTFPYACVCVCVFLCGKITIFISDGSRVCLLRTLRIVCVGSLSKANSEIKAHKFILANCWNKRKKESQMVREPSRYYISGCPDWIITRSLIIWEQNAHLSCGISTTEITNNYFVNSFLT